MKNSTKNLIKVNLKNGNNKLACLLALLGNVDNNNEVYLPNAYDAVAHVLSPTQWAGYLSVLKIEGVYNPTGEYFGEIDNNNKQ